jgi:CBS domain-containing protein
VRRSRIGGILPELLSFVISRHYQPIAVYEALLRQDGIHLPPASGYDPSGWTARDLMTVEAPFVAPESTIDVAWDEMVAGNRPASIVGTPDRMVGIVTRRQLAAARDGNRGDEAVRTVLDEHAVHVHPDHPLDVVFERFGASGGLLPVVSRSAVHRVEGAIGSTEMTALAKRRPSRR